MTYNSKVLHEQGGSVLRVDSGGSIQVNAGGTISGAGTFALTGALNANGGVNSTSNVTGASITATTAVWLGSNVQLMFAASAAAPSGLPVTASPGAVFFRSDGANSAGYVNTSDGTAGSVWTIFSEL